MGQEDDHFLLAGGVNMRPLPSTGLHKTRTHTTFPVGGFGQHGHEKQENKNFCCWHGTPPLKSLNLRHFWRGRQKKTLGRQCILCMAGG